MGGQPVGEGRGGGGFDSRVFFLLRRSLIAAQGADQRRFRLAARIDAPVNFEFVITLKAENRIVQFTVDIAVFDRARLKVL